MTTIYFHVLPAPQNPEFEGQKLTYIPINEDRAALILNDDEMMKWSHSVYSMRGTKTITCIYHPGHVSVKEVEQIAEKLVHQ